MSKKNIRIALAEDQLLLRRIMADLLEEEADLSVVFEADNGRELLQFMQQGKADLVMTDIEMPQVNGIELTAQLRETRPDVPVMVLSSHEGEATIMEAIEAGAKGYLIKNSPPDEVLQAIRSVMENGFYFKEDISKLLLRGVVERKLLHPRFAKKELLSSREREVLQLICQEMTNKEIAEQLHLSPRTIESYRKNMLEKIGARNTAGLVIYAVKNGIYEWE